MGIQARGIGGTFLAAALLPWLLVHPASGELDFEPWVQYVTGGWNCTGIALADFDRDGDMDIYASHRVTNDVVVMLNDGNGVFESAAVCTVGNMPRYVRSSDLNGDGWPDFATPDYNGSTVSIGLHNGSERLNLHQMIHVYKPTILELADVDLDGDVDVIVPHWDEAQSQPSTAPSLVTILLNDGAGNFEHGSSVPIGIQPRGMAIDDFNGDGYPDVIVCNLYSSDLDLLLNAGDGSFLPSQWILGPLSPREVCTGDWNRDGEVDYAVVSKTMDRVYFMVNDGDQHFSQWAEGTTGDSPHSCAAIDLDGDLDMDVVVSHVGSGYLKIYENTGTTFALPVQYTSPSGAAEVLVGQLDGDSLPDIVTGNTNNATISVHINDSETGDPNPGKSCRGDIDASGTVDVLDMLEVISHWGDCEEGACMVVDLNDDGGVGVLDLLLVLEVWGDCDV